MWNGSSAGASGGLYHVGRGKHSVHKPREKKTRARTVAYTEADCTKHECTWLAG